MVWSWGSNASGELGRPVSGWTAQPGAIAGLPPIARIGAGQGHGMATTAAGAVYTWGANGDGQLGDGSTTGRESAAAISGDGVTWFVATPTLSVAGGTYTTDRTVVVSSPTPDATIRYTRTGADPTESDPLVLSGASLLVEASQTLKAKAWKSGMAPSPVASATYVMTVAGPVLTPPPGPFTSAPTVVLSSATPGVTFHYTLDGSTPTAASPAYTAPVAVTTTSTLQAVGIKTGWTGSGVQGGAYTMHFGTLSAPAVLPATGTYTSDVSVTMSTTQTGAVIRYTTDGTTPTASSPIYTDAVAVTATGTTVTATAFHPDYTASAATTRVYTLAAPTPSITPATGTYTSGQTVTITGTGPSATLRYTTDGSEPTASATEYTAPFVVATGTTLTARAFPANGWAPSAAASAVLTFDYGTLDPPVAAPAGGAFASAPEVTLSASAGTTIRYTLNGTTPTESSPAYTGPVAIPTGGATLKARAFHPDWTASAERNDDYLVDAVPPTIAVDRFPAAHNSWHLTPVTLSFRCHDNIGVASCSAPATVDQEGAGHIVTGTAVDTAGKETPLPVTVNVDLTPPTVSLTSPAEGLVTTASSVVLTGAVADALSGLDAVRCNDVVASVVNGEATCTISLRPGRNAVALTARDLAGHSTSAGLTVTRVGTASRITLTPSVRSMLVDETGVLSLVDDYGVPVSGATWGSNQPSIVALSTDDPPVLTALATGQAVVTAQKHGLSTQATITVVAGDVLPDGTTRWVVPPTPNANLRRDPPIHTNRIDASGPDLFAVETDVTTWERTVHAVTASGEVQWLMASPGIPLMGDSFGGLVAGVEPAPNTCRAVFGEFERCYKALARFAGPTPAAVWRYESPGLVDRPAQGPDGTIYVLEHPGQSKALVILNGATGQVTARVPLASVVSDKVATNPQFGCQSSHQESAPLTAGPVVGGDGQAYLVVSERRRALRVLCESGWVNGSFQSWETVQSDVTELGMTLLRLSATGPVGQDVLDDRQCAGAGCLEPRPEQVLPDGIGGMLVTALWNAPGDQRVTRIDREGGRVDTPIAVGTRIEMIGQGGKAYLHTKQSAVTSVSKDVVDVQPWTLIWSLPLDWNWLAAGPEGAAAVERSGERGHFDPAGALINTSPHSATNAVPSLGDWYGNAGAGLTATAGQYEHMTYWDATYQVHAHGTEEPRRYGSSSGQNAPPVPRLVHFVVPPELAIPSSGDPYLPQAYETDVRGDYFAGRLQAIPSFFNVEKATAEQFLKEVGSGKEVIAFIGHSVLIPERPQWGSVGLTFHGSSIVKEMSPEQPFGPGGQAMTMIVNRINPRSRIVFVAACDTGDVFKSLWDIDSSVANRSLIVPVGAETDLYWAAQAWRVIAASLGIGKTSGAALADGNTYLANQNRPLRFQIIGGQNVRIR